MSDPLSAVLALAWVLLNGATVVLSAHEMAELTPATRHSSTAVQRELTAWHLRAAAGDLAVAILLALVGLVALALEALPAGTPAWVEYAIPALFFLAAGWLHASALMKRRHRRRLDKLLDDPLRAQRQVHAKRRLVEEAEDDA